MIRRPPKSTRTDTLLPYTTLFRSSEGLLKQRLDGAQLAKACSAEDWPRPASAPWAGAPLQASTEEHTSELQSVMRISYSFLCLEKKKQMRWNSAHDYDRPAYINTAHDRHTNYTKHGTRQHTG